MHEFSYALSTGSSMWPPNGSPNGSPKNSLISGGLFLVLEWIYSRQCRPRFAEPLTRAPWRMKKKTTRKSTPWFNQLWLQIKKCAVSPKTAERIIFGLVALLFAWLKTLFK